MMMEYNKYKYAVDGVVHDLEVESVWDGDDPEMVADDCATNFYNEHDGREATWPLTFEIVGEDGASLGRYEIHLEFDPSFYCTALDASNESEG